MTLIGIFDRLIIPDFVAAAGSPTQFHVCASWRSDGPEDHCEHEGQVVAIVPAGGEEVELTPAMQFSFGPDKRRVRFDVVMGKPLPFTAPGQLVLEARLRKVGDEPWMAQRFVIDVEDGPPPEGGYPVPRTEVLREG